MFGGLIMDPLVGRLHKLRGWLSFRYFVHIVHVPVVVNDAIEADKS